VSLPAVPAWLATVLSADVLHRLGWVVVHSLWQAAAVAAVLAVLLRLVPRRSAAALQARYLLATAALVAMPVACVVTSTLVQPPAAAVAAEGNAATRRTLILPAAVAATVERQSQAAAPPGIDARAAVAALVRHVAAAVAPWLPWCAAAWLAGATAAAGRLGAGWWLTRRLVARAIAPADARWQARLDRWKHALGIDQPIRLLAATRIDVPVVVGWLRPVVLWPLAALTGMPPDQIDAILAHELAHVRRHDVFVNLLQSCIETLFFHHPAAWWISAQVRAEREHCADDLAIRVLDAGRGGAAISYARALVALEERRRHRATLAVAADGGSLVDRVGRIVGITPEAGHPARLAAALLMLAAAIAAAAAVATKGRQASADEGTVAGLPADTNTIESLTPQQARRLAKEFPGVEVEIEIKGYGKQKVPACLPMNGLKSLDSETARALAAYGKGPLLLDGLTTLDADTAKALAECQSSILSLDGLTTLDAETARVLAEFEGGLSLDGLTTLDAATAKALAECQSHILSLDGLSTLDADTAKVLAEFKGVQLSLDGLTTLDAETAKALAEFKGSQLLLSGLTKLDGDTAKALVEFKGNKLYLNGLSTLDAATAEALAEFKGDYLSLDGLTALDAETAKAIAELKGKWLYLNGLTTLDAETAKAIAELKGEVALPDKVLQALFAKNPLTPETALAWAVVSNGKLSHVTALDSPDSVAIAQALATREGRLALPNLKKISPKTLTALIEKEDVEIPLIETLELIPEPDGSANDDFVIPEGLEKRGRK